MKSFIKPVQTAVYSAITGDATIMAKITGVFDFPPKDQPYPFVTIGEATVIPWRTHSQPGVEATLTLHIWSATRIWR
jgi:hypothetical protein